MVGIKLMPMKPARPCPGRGKRRGSCPNLIRGNEICCPDCMPYIKKAIREYDKTRDETPGRQFLHSRQWRRIRERKLGNDPLCQKCQENGIITAAFLVHHINENELDNDPNNHLSLCGPCHETIHKTGRWGKGGNHVFQQTI